MKKNTIPIIVGISAFALVIIGSTFAYFASTYTTVGTTQTTNLSTQSVTTVVYNNSSEINLQDANPGTTQTASFNLVYNAFSPTAIAQTYNIVWNITNNTFTGTGELLYTLSKSTDNINWTNVATDVDCTTFTGENTIATNETISSLNGATTTIYWRFTLNFVNKADAQGNMNADLAGYLSVTGIS